LPAGWCFSGAGRWWTPICALPACASRPHFQARDGRPATLRNRLHGQSKAAGTHSSHTATGREPAILARPAHGPHQPLSGNGSTG
jgi:hypothetical protein